VATRIVRPLAWLSAAVVLALSLSPPRYRIVTGAPRDLEHFAAFALVGLMLSLAYPEQRLKLVAFGPAAIAAIELVQFLVPGRHAYLADFLLNTFGFWLGIAGALMATRTSLRCK
jgi:VanZ family protein